MIVPLSTLLYLMISTSAVKGAKRSMRFSLPISPEEAQQKYHFLDNPQIVAKLLEFDEENTQIVSLYIPHIHCSSCIWVLENLQKLHKGVLHALVDFPKKIARISFQKDKITLKELVELLAQIGYAPYISLDDYKQKKDQKGQKQLLYKLGVAGFAFGNIGLSSAG